jgi:hypothetical protein
MIRLALISFFAFTVLLGFNSAKMARPTPEPRANHFTCELDIALAATDASAAIVSGTTRSVDTEKIKREPRSVIAKPEHHEANLIGRGVANCKNQQGFQFNLPAILAISIDSADPIPLHEIRATLPPISVDRDVNRIFDHYTPHVVLENTPTTSPNPASERSVVVKGDRNEVLLQINLNIPSEFTSRIKVSRADLRFDNEAPSLGE